MAIIQIVQAKKDSARLVIGLSGISGEGKTYSALMLAYGMVNYDPTKIGFLDTENRRGRLYANIFKKHPTHPSNEPFLIADLEPPHSPARYAQAIKEFSAWSNNQIEVLIIDSVTHEYEGTGGVQEIAEINALGNGIKKRPNWALAKKEHRGFMNSMLQANPHVIACIRAREKGKEVEQDAPGGGKKKVWVSEGVQPIQEKNFMFEMTASLMMWNKGQAQAVHKCPEELLGILGRETGYITSEDGLALRRWLEDGGDPMDQKVEAMKNALKNETEGGEVHYLDCWNKLKAGTRKAIGKEFHETMLEAARGYDKVAELRQMDDDGSGEQGSQTADAVNNMLGDD